MSVEFTLFDPSDLDDFTPISQFRDDFEELSMLPLETRRVLCTRYAWTAWDQYGRARGSCGINDGEAWAFLAPDLKPGEVIAVTRKVRQILNEHVLNTGPVRATVLRHFAPAVRWASALGFQVHSRVTPDYDVWVYQ